MSASEIVPGVYTVKGKFAGEFGFISSYILVDNGEALIIDPGTAGDPGADTIEALKLLGLKPKGDVVGLLCTHGHPDHIGGAGILRRRTGAPILIHEKDSEMLSSPGSFLKERLRLDLAGRIAMKTERGPLRVNYRAAEADRVFNNEEKIGVGELSLRVIHTGGHSAGHCVFYESTKKVLFSGDEINNFPNDPRKFYVDLSGSLTAKQAAAEKLARLPIENLLPSHDVAHLLGDVALQFEEVRDGIIQFQDAILHHLTARSEANIEQLVFDIERARSIPYPTALPALLPTTLQVCLEDLAKAGLVSVDDKEVWSLR
jgi:glyoxylase-like metal-dependent hydrolase (beta-lactamase superfamily II)